jgi:hypothetical protein
MLYGWDFHIRFRGNIRVESAEGEARSANDWAPPTGRALMLRNPSVTDDRAEVPAVVVVHAKGMKEPCCLVTSRKDFTDSEVVKRYGRRFTIEATFRDGGIAERSPESRRGYPASWRTVERITLVQGPSPRSLGLRRSRGSCSARPSAHPHLRPAVAISPPIPRGALEAASRDGSHRRGEMAAVVGTNDSLGGSVERERDLQE